MATDSKYGQIDIPGIPDDEPVFVLRAKDKLAYSTLLEYESIALRRRRGVDIPDQFLENLENVIAKFEKWADENSDKMKFPD